jgi:hypothetical protein
MWNPPITMIWNQNTLLALRDKHEKWLLSQPPIYGTAVGKDHDGRLSLKIFVGIDSITPDEMRAIAEHIGDVPLSFIETPPLFQHEE